MRKGGDELDQNMGKDFADSSFAGLGPYVAPDGGNCCGFILTKSGEPCWRFARHGSLQLGNGKMQIKETDQAVHLLVYIHFCEARAEERSARSEATKECRRNRGIARRRENGKRKGKSLEV